MFSPRLNINVQSRTEHRLLENPYKSMFLSLYSLYLLKGFPQYKGRVVFFENPTQKISTLLPLLWGIRRELIYRQAEQTKNEDVVARLGFASIPAEPPIISFTKISLLPIHLREVPGG